MKLTNILFQRYRSSAYPRTHKTKPDQRLPEGVTFYAIPGGTIATEDDCRRWGLQYGVKVTFETYALGAK